MSEEQLLRVFRRFTLFVFVIVIAGAMVVDRRGRMFHFPLARLPCTRGLLARRREIAAAYDTGLAELPIKLPWQHPDTASAWHLYIIRLDRRRVSRSHREVFDALREAGVGANLHYIPVYRQPYYRALGFGQGYCPNAEAYYAEAISLPMYPDLSAEEQQQVIAAVARAVTG